GKLRRQIAKLFSRTYLLGKWLGLEVKQPESQLPGLIVLQIDGLSRQQFEAAVAKNRLPFLKKMMNHGYFNRLSFYSGLPSTTPAVQAEVMYGVRCVVPAFQFLHRATGRVFRMCDQEAAATIVREQTAQGTPLLTGGSSYSNLYSGGSSEAEFCAETQSVRLLIKRIRPLRLCLTLFLYTFTLLRISWLALIELVIAIGDMIHGVLRRDWKNEIRFVPARVLVSVVLREWVRIVVKLSIASGTPVVYANLLGYDEQSHRRGPASAFAHWGLRGIDGVVKDIFRFAQHADGRDYEVIVFSDHGQESVRIYEFEYGKSIQQAVTDVLRHGPLAQRIVRSLDGNPESHRRFQHWRRRNPDLHNRENESDRLTPKQLSDEVIVTAMGPIGHVYVPVALTDAAKAEYAACLVQQENVPLVLYRCSDQQVFGRNRQGLWNVREDSAMICGIDHKFVNEIRDDLITLCAHPDSGDLIISGWDPEQRPLTFVQENGAHGSLGFQETRGFALLPQHLPVRQHEIENGERFIRGLDLHAAAWHFLHPDRALSASLRQPFHRTPIHFSPRVSQSTDPGALAASGMLRVMTYNIHHSMGLDGRCRPLRIADVIAESGADVVALQEVDKNRARTSFQDQAAVIASRLEMNYRFFPLLTLGQEQYGLAILSRVPMHIVREGILQQGSSGKRRESRGAMWVALEGRFGLIHLINTHLGLTKAERLCQIEELLSDRWLGDIESREPVIICGDLNAGPRSEVLKRLTMRFHCTQSIAVDHRPQATFASIFPLRQIDYILVSSHFSVSSSCVSRNHMAKAASDHLPVCAALKTDRKSKAPVPMAYGWRPHDDEIELARSIFEVEGADHISVESVAGPQAAD
ncbi:MAG: endonuclease/exonuclease/phosphatase family protein, partial [Planctomycetaceae bacterium]|nr:endonuclease/exonuclease/phosphatase family protein [Planctomycetaceae bacterium]